MSKAKFTEGPWEYRSEVPGLYARIISGNNSIFVFRREPNPNNANLIAASPELYYALEWALSCLPEDEWKDDLPDAYDMIMQGKSALAKARGE